MVGGPRTVTILERVKDLERQCHFFHAEVEKMSHMSSRVQKHELKIFNLEEAKKVRNGNAYTETADHSD